MDKKSEEGVEELKQYLWKQLLLGNCPVEFASLGRWWGNDPIEKSQTEIDIKKVQTEIAIVAMAYDINKLHHKIQDNRTGTQLHGELSA